MAGEPIGIIGGSGFYEFLTDAQTVSYPTPYGDPSAGLTHGVVAGHPVVFLPRHGVHHEFPAHRVNYRANLWAMRAAGVRRIVSPCAAGALAPGVHPGDFVVLSQLVDRTQGRADTYYDGPDLHHVGFADPYCPVVADAIASGARRHGETVHTDATVVVINGPRFSTRAESHWYRAQGWHAINMTQYPEAVLARELGLCFGGVALITDYDSGALDDDASEAVDMAAVLAVLRDNVERLRGALTMVVEDLAAAGDGACHCASGAGPALD
jgi:5'-methylthioadenosine phosphorylase